MQTEWSQKKKKKLYINTYIRNLERSTDEPMVRAAMETQTQRTDLRKWVSGEKERVGWMERVAWEHIHNHMQNTWPVGICCTAQRTRIRSLWQPRRVGWDGRWGGSSRRRRCMCTYGWYMLIYGRNEHNIINTIYFSIKNKFKEYYILLGNIYIQYKYEDTYRNDNV